MEKIKYIPLGLLVAFCLKALVIPTTTADIGIMAVLAGLVAFYEYQLERSVLVDLKKQTELQNIAIENTYKEVQSLKSFVTSMKMNQLAPQQRVPSGKSNFTF